MNSSGIFRVNYFNIQWHITDRCNWHCKHCYREEKRLKELTFKDIKKIFLQCLELFKFFHLRSPRSRLTITGGEPFLRRDLFRILSFLSRYKRFMELGIMTNGAFITSDVAKDLKRLGIQRVQVSLEGARETNDIIRGPGTFDKIIEGIKKLKKYNLIVCVSLTLTQLNFPEIEELAVYLKKIGVDVLGLRRFVPIGRGKELIGHMFSPQEQRSFYFKKIELQEKLNEKDKFTIAYGCDDGIASLLVLEEEKANFKIHHRSCGVIGTRILTILPNGDIYPCRRLPILLGNVLKDSLLEIYFSSDKLWSFKNSSHPLCRECSVFNLCQGGARCISQAYFGRQFAPDPQCWRIFKRLPKPKISEL